MSGKNATLERRALLRTFILTVFGMFTGTGSMRVSAADRPAPFPAQAIPSSIGEAGLDPDLSMACQSQPAAARVLRLLSGCPTTMMAVSDIAARVGSPAVEVQIAVDTLNRMGFLRRISVGPYRFYGITGENRRLEEVKRFQNWCELQRRHWEALQHVVA
jgi:hypothetical protein